MSFSLEIIFRESRLKPITLYLLMLLSIGCTFVESARVDFVRTREFDIGRLISEIPLQAPEDIEEKGDGLVIYIYSFVNDHSEGAVCKWAYYIDTMSNRVVRWEFISDPLPCYRSYEFGNPW